MDIHALIADAKPPARTVELCLRGDLVADLEQATRDLALAREHNDADGVAAATERAAAARRAMSGAVLVVRFEGIPRREWLAMLGEHPPRDDSAADRQSGFNTETLYEAMIRRAWASPEVTPADLDALLAVINDGQFNEMAEAAFTATTKGAHVPFGWRDYSSPPD